MALSGARTAAAVSAGGFKPSPETRAIVIVEGKNLEFLIRGLFPKLLQTRQIWVLNGGGRDDMQSAFDVLVRTSGFREHVKAVGAIYDAEGDKTGTARSLSAAFRAAGLAVPQAPLKPASPGPAGGPNTAYLIVPHEKESGCIEDMLLEAYAGNQPPECVERFMSCLQQPDRRDSSAINNWKAKVKVHSLIAASAKPEQTLGESAKAGLWNADHSGLAPIKKLLELI